MGRKRAVVFDEQPPDFDPTNLYRDLVAMIEMREHIVQEKWIDIKTSKIIRDKLRWCYRIEGVNHLQKCRHLVQQYQIEDEEIKSKHLSESPTLWSSRGGVTACYGFRRIKRMNEK